MRSLRQFFGVMLQLLRVRLDARRSGFDLFKLRLDAQTITLSK